MPTPVPRGRRRPADTHLARYLRDKSEARAMITYARRYSNYHNALLRRAEEEAEAAAGASVTAGAAAATAASCEVDGAEEDDTL